jgi:hypothetical protein
LPLSTKERRRQLAPCELAVLSDFLMGVGALAAAAALRLLPDNVAAINTRAAAQRPAYEATSSWLQSLRPGLQERLHPIEDDVFEQLDPAMLAEVELSMSAWREAHRAETGT